MEQAWIVLLAMALSPSPPTLPDAGAVSEDCSYDLSAMLELDYREFDQTLDGGWRPLADQGCELAAAELIREWRFEKRVHDSILYWHEGQLRALAGETQDAIRLFMLTYRPPELDGDFGWNAYVSGTINFLRKDRERVEAAREELLALPKPEENTAVNPQGEVVELPWPPNLDVLDAFLRCWEDDYKTAYTSQPCRRPDEAGID